jgi:hypothetical protein
MARPKLFIGSSKRSLSVANLVADGLEECVDVTIWDEGVFSLNQGFLERLLDILVEFDFAVLIWAADDVTDSKAESKASPRDNVIFECGLFMGALGRDRVFIIHDQSIDLKIPSDLAGVSLATFEGARVAQDGKAAVRQACNLIKKEIEKPRFPEIVGDWTSKYALTAEAGRPQVLEAVEIKAARGGVSISSKHSPVQDDYVAYGRILLEKQIVGDWRNQAGKGGGRGLFLLTVNPRGTVIYGYCTGPDENDGLVYAQWVLAKNDGVDEETIKQRLAHGERLLHSNTITLARETAHNA